MAATGCSPMRAQVAYPHRAHLSDCAPPAAPAAAAAPAPAQRAQQRPFSRLRSPWARVRAGWRLQRRPRLAGGGGSTPGPLPRLPSWPKGRQRHDSCSGATAPERTEQQQQQPGSAAGGTLSRSSSRTTSSANCMAGRGWHHGYHYSRQPGVGLRRTAPPSRARRSMRGRLGLLLRWGARGRGCASAAARKTPAICMPSLPPAACVAEDVEGGGREGARLDIHHTQGAEHVPLARHLRQHGGPAMGGRGGRARGGGRQRRRAARHGGRASRIRRRTSGAPV